MAIIDRELVRAVNSGRCFALVGSGPSCDLGVPSWKRLAELITAKVALVDKGDAAEKCRALIAQKHYSEAFRWAEKTLGRDVLLASIGGWLGGASARSRLYEHIASWPFSCYLTTNYDDYLASHLEDLDLAVVVRRNSQQDLRALRADSRNIVFKIHGDLTTPHDVVLTSDDYRDFLQSDARAYWREKISAVLHMVDLVIVGYSASDPDFQEQLERAKQVANPDRPVFMFAADMDVQEVREYYQRFNIRIVPYRNADGTHRDLQRVIHRYTPFIARRGSPTVGLEPVDESVATLSASMYLFTQLRLADSGDVCIRQVYSSLILQSLAQMPQMHNVSIDVLRGILSGKTFVASHLDPTAFYQSLERLYSLGYVRMTGDHLAVSVEPKGLEALATVQAQRTLIRDKFQKACEMFLKREYSGLDSKGIERIIDTMRAGLVLAYEKRGMEIAKSVFSGGAVDVSDASDVLETINKAGSCLDCDDQRAAFADLMIEVMLCPAEEMKEYLGLLSQGYFAYHALGLEPTCSHERLDIARQKKWVLDSSVLLEIIAVDCLNYSYAKDLLERMRSVGLDYCATERLYQEIRDHAWWAITNFSAAVHDTPALVQAAIAGPGFKQNLFLDGFMKWSFGRSTPTLDQYFKHCLGDDYRTNLGACIRARLADWGVSTVDFTSWHGFSQTAWPERDAIAEDIERLRVQNGTYTRESQCIAEAEVVLACSGGQAAFLSQSGILNKLSRPNTCLTLKPEAMYRFLSLFSSTPAGTDLLYDSMVQDFFTAGFDIVDKRTITQFVQPMVHQARMQFDQEKERYEQALGSKRFGELRDEFDRVPDEQKPFYSMQFAYYVASEEQRKRHAAEARAQSAERSKSLTEKERQELAKLRGEKKERRKRDRTRKRKSQSRPQRIRT